MESTIADPYGTVVWPVTPHPAPIGLQEFGSYRAYYEGGHRGSDYPVGTGTPVVAISNGTVTVSARNGDEGNHVDVQHDNGLRTHSIHLSRRDVIVGQRVSAGQQLGLSGNDGAFSKGAHLHIEVFRDGGRIDPHAFFLQFVGLGSDTPTNPALKELEDMFVIRATESGIVPAGTKLMIALRNSHSVAADTLDAARISEAQIVDIKDLQLRTVLRDNGIPERYAADYNELGQVHTNILSKIIDARNVVTSTLGDTHANAMSRLKDLFVGLSVTWK